MSPNITKLLPTITPLGRLILIALSASSTPLSLPALCVATGGTATHLALVLRGLAARRLITRAGGGSAATYALAPPQEATDEL